MALADIQALLENTNATVNNMDQTITNINTESIKVLRKIDLLIDDGGPSLLNIEKSLQKIENFAFIIMIVILVMICVIFIFWLVIHIWPLIRGLHTHEHNVDTVLQDLTTVPAYQHNHHQINKLHNQYLPKHEKAS